jgi:hypothetical protein
MNREHAQRVVDDMSRSNDSAAWCNGYQTAVDALRWMADHLSDDDTAEAVRMLATALESMKP